MPEEQNAPPPSEAEQFNFDSVYANNSHFEPSEWDLKVFFGQLEQHSGKPKVEWHTAVTMPWMQAKILAYYLRINIAIHEISSGKIKLPQSLTPLLPTLPSEADEHTKALYEFVKTLHAEMFG